MKAIDIFAIGAWLVIAYMVMFVSLVPDYTQRVKNSELEYYRTVEKIPSHTCLANGGVWKWYSNNTDFVKGTSKTGYICEITHRWQEDWTYEKN